jgi:hypothetical protein
MHPPKQNLDLKVVGCVADPGSGAFLTTDPESGMKQIQILDPDPDPVPYF